MSGKKKQSKEELIEAEEKYVEFLRKRINSENYKQAVTPEQLQKDKQKYDKAKLKLKFLRS